MITTKDKIGFIQRRTDENGKQTFEYIESKIKRVVIGKRKTAVYSDKFYPLEIEELERNTEIFDKQNGILIVGEPFITNKELAEWCQKNVDYWNKHGARSIWDD